MNHTPVASMACDACHETGMAWYGVNMRDRPKDHYTGQDCGGCHNTNSFGGNSSSSARMKKVATAPARSTLPLVPGSGLARVAEAPGTPADSAAWPPATPAHAGVAPRSCGVCHRVGGSATAKPVHHLPTAFSCDLCHRSTAWSPATYSHAGVAPGSCATCHAGGGATAKPASHFLSAAGCDACHHATTGWTSVGYAHLTPKYAPHPASVRCVDCHPANNQAVVWRYPTLQPGCGGCHGMQFRFTAGKKSIGAPRTLPR